MPKNNEREAQSIASKDVGALEDVLSPVAVPEPSAEAPKAPEPDSAPAPSEPTMTVEAFARRALKKDSLAIAFVSGETRTNGVRKLPEQEWRDLYAAFLVATR